MLDPDAPVTGSEPTETAPAPRRRRAASRPAGPPQPRPEPTPAAESTPSTEPEPTGAEPGRGAVVEVPVTPELTAEAPAEERKPAARRRRSRAASPEADAPVTKAPSADDQLADAAASLPALDAAAAPAELTAPDRPAKALGRGRRRAALETAGDPLEESLAELSERPARRVKDKVANPFTPADVTAALDSLAAAIGAGAPAAAEDGEEVEDVEEALGPEAEAEDAASEEATDEESDEVGEDDESIDDEGSGARRRRRRRGGRRRRRSGADDREEETEGEAEEADEETEATDEASESAAEGDAPSESAGRRRRRRRRRGEDTGADAEDGVDVVVKVREPRKSNGLTSDQITGIEGSTRMEAKKQRRREGRAAGRRRAPILSEAEFLARRESVDRMMLIRQADDYTQIAVLEDGVLVEHYVDRDSSASMIGNVYLGRVQNILPSMEAAFIDIGRGRNAVLYAGEVDWDAFGVTGADRKVEKVLKSGQAILVQVTKDPVGAKGARLTSHVSIPGRYVVYAPGGHLSGISRKLPESERNRLKSILDEVVGADASVIVRTAAEGASTDELVRDVSRLKAQWEIIEKKVKGGQAPQQLYSEPDLTVRIVRDLFTEDFSALIVDGNGRGEDAFDTVQAYVTHVAPHLQERLRHWQRDSEGDLFHKFRVHEQVAKALERKVHLPSGGSLIIDRTEAMTVVDVNTGKFTGTQGNLEATVTSNNLEAAEEIVRQLRLRDIGGIIVIDFIDMVLPANRELLLRRLVECLGRDRTRHQVAEVTSLGLVQMTRKKIGTGLHEAFTVPCETCKARGYHVHSSPVATQAPSDGGDHGRRGRGSRGSNGSGDQASAD